jgi:2'-5' RNA ligase
MNYVLDEFISRVRQVFNNAGVDIRDGYDFVPHVTLMKLSKGLDTVSGVSRLPPFTHRNFRDMEFGVQQVTSVDLCTMTNERSDTGFYVTPLHLELLTDDAPIVQEISANSQSETAS